MALSSNIEAGLWAPRRAAIRPPAEAKRTSVRTRDGKGAPANSQPSEFKRATPKTRRASGRLREKESDLTISAPTTPRKKRVVLSPTRDLQRRSSSPKEGAFSVDKTRSFVGVFFSRRGRGGGPLRLSSSFAPACRAVCKLHARGTHPPREIASSYASCLHSETALLYERERERERSVLCWAPARALDRSERVFMREVSSGSPSRLSWNIRWFVSVVSRRVSR